MKKIILLLFILSTHFRSDAQRVSAGTNYSMWLPCSGSIPQLWGKNSDGQLGDGTTINRQTPILTSGLTGVTAISAGGEHSLFLKNDSTVWSCGFNAIGMLGDGTTFSKTTPIQVSTLSNVMAISAGGQHSLFLKNDGTAWACGANNHGQLGDGTSTNKLTPVQVSGLNNVIAISAGETHSLFLKSDGTVWACGWGILGQLGVGTILTQLAPVQITSLSGITSINAGSFYSLFIKNDSTVWSCGYNAFGQLGDNSTTNRLTPVQITSLSGIIKIDAAYNHSLFMKNNGTIWACGDNSIGQLGDGTTVNRLSPVQVSGLNNVIDLSGGYFHSLFLKNDGTIKACGLNSVGQIGNGTTINYINVVQTSYTGDFEINVKGNNLTIFDGDITPSATDHTNFGSVVVNTSPIRTFTIQNTGTSNLYITSITSSNALFTMGTLSPASPIVPGDSAIFNITFSPINTGIKNATITINNNDCDEGVYTYAIRGNSVTTCPTLTFNETHIEACIGSTDGVITLSALAGGTGSYTFSKDSGLTYQSSATFSNLAPGIYQMRNKDMNGCESAAVAVNVNDQTPPIIICPPNFTAYQSISDNCLITYADTLIMISDNCLMPVGSTDSTAAIQAPRYRINGGIKFLNYIGGGTQTSTGAVTFTEPLPLGPNYITYYATDSVGNTDSCTQIITVVDTVAPLFEPIFNNYAFETDTAVGLEDLSSGATEIIPAGSDNVSCTVQTIPFFFDFHSVVYTNFSVSSNGLLGFGTNPVTTSAVNSTTVNQNNKVYASWDNLHTGTNGSVKYKVIGTLPNRKLVIEWNVRNAAESGNYTKTFQAWLWEGSHKVQLVFGSGTNFPSATMGVRGANSSVYNDVTTSNHSSSKTTINDANTLWPGSGRTYIFSPAIFATAPSGSCSTNVTWSIPNFIDCNDILWNQSHQSGDNFPIGTTQLIYTVSDATPPPNPIAMNTTTYTIPVIVEDLQAPVITCGGPVSVNTIPGLCTGAATIIPPTVTDNCSSFAINNDLNFDGINDIVKVASTSVISTVSQTKRTVEVSFKVNDKNISSQKQVIWEEGGSSSGLNMYVYNGSLYYGIYSTNNGWTGTWLNTSNIVSGQWHSASLVYDGTAVYGRLKAYLDGSLIGSADSSATLGNALAVHNVGNNGIGALASSGRFHDGTSSLSEGHYFGGEIDELRIWNVARTSAEFTSASRSHLIGSEIGLVLYYNFNQGTACGNNAGLNFLDDMTATNLNGVVTNMTLNGSCVSNWTTGAPAYSSPITLTNSFNNSSDASGNYPIGTTNVIWTASDANGNAVTCTQAVTVTDNQAPTLVAPSNQNLNVVANTCAANYNILDPISDNCEGQGGISWGYTTTGTTVLSSGGNTKGNGSNSGQLSFNKGVTTVTLTGTDGTNAATSVTFTVTVNDNQTPTLVAPLNQNLNVIANTCAANYTIADPVSDNCTGATWGYSTTGATVLSSSGNTRNDGQNSGVLSFNKGVTTVTLTGTDGTNAASSVTFTVTVNDNQSPTLVAPLNQNLNVIANTCAANYTIADPFSDNCTGGNWGYSTTGATTLTSSGNTRNDGQSSGVLSFNKGVTTVTLTGTDGTNAATSVTFTVTVNDNQAPTLVAPLNQNLNVIANTCAANYTIADPFSDNCTGGNWGYSTTGATTLTSSGNTRNDGQSSGVLSFNKGVTTVTLSGTDGTNAATSVTFTVTVIDNQAPTLVAPSNQSLNVIANTCAANYTIADPFSDNCTGGNWGYSTTGATTLTSSGNTRNDGQSSVVLSFNKGVTIVTLTGTDGTNAATSVTFTVTVIDNQAPTLVAPSNQSLNVGASTCTANYTIADPISDNCSGALWGYSSTGATVLTTTGNTRNDGQGSGVLTFNKGVTIVTLTGTDGTNAATTSTFTVTVNDNQVITVTASANTVCSGASTLLTASGASSYTWTGGVINGVSFIPTTTTTYTVTGTATNGCTKTATKTITVNSLPAVTATASSNPICIGTALVLNGGGAATYIWSHAVSNNVSFMPYESNTYTVSGTDANGCINTSSINILVNPCGNANSMNVKLFIQGFYTGMSTMTTTLLNQGVGTSPTDVDNIMVELRNYTAPYSLAASSLTILQTNGTTTATFTPTPYGFYYIVIKHRNSIETWSANPVLIQSNSTYDFSTSIDKAYANNQVEVETGVFALFTGDINQDGYIDGFDYPYFDTDSQNNVSGMYATTDLNGDGYVDGFDYPVFDVNSQNNVTIATP